MKSDIFDDAQLSVFKVLLPYWAGFQKSYKPDEDEKKKRPGKETLSMICYNKWCM